MSQHNHKHSEHENHKHHHEHKEKTGIRNLHKDWRTWAAIVLMLAAMAAYVLTLDDSVVPGARQEQSAPTTR